MNQRPNQLHDDSGDAALDAMLAAASRQLESAPAGLAKRVQSTLERQDAARNRARRLGWALSAGAVAAAVLAGWFILGQRVDRRIDPIGRQVVAVESMPDREQVQRAIVAVPDNSIALSIPSREPSVTIVWVYPCVARTSAGER